MVRTLSKATQCPTMRAMMSARARAMPSTSVEAVEEKVGAKASAEEAKVMVEEAKASAEEAKALAEVAMAEVVLAEVALAEVILAEVVALPEVAVVEVVMVEVVMAEVTLVEVVLAEVASAEVASEVGASVRVVTKARARSRAKVMADLPSMSQASASTPQLKAWNIILGQPARSHMPR